ncbi:MAG TPA: hypothetical protein VKB86_04775 [Pyrinomonadaceae bacterium]|nr:hypothetical protein [Pyrinomonadaceae bacterium]
MKKIKDEYRAKVIDDSGLVRGRIPTPVLNLMGTRPGDSVTFRPTRSGEVIMRVSRARAKAGRKSSRKSSRKTARGKRR